MFDGTVLHNACACTQRCEYFQLTARRVQTVADHEEFKQMTTGASRISEDRHYSATAAAQQGQTCAGDHGTHVAALAAGYEVGAAKDATVVSGAPQACPRHGALDLLWIAYPITTASLQLLQPDKASSKQDLLRTRCMLACGTINAWSLVC